MLYKIYIDQKQYVYNCPIEHDDFNEKYFVSFFSIFIEYFTGQPFIK